MAFLDHLKQTTNVGVTENAALSNASTLDPVLDFFSKGGAMRFDPEEGVRLFELAYAQDHKLAMKALFYLRDIRGGQGERRMFRLCLQRLGEIDPNNLQAVLPLVAEYGRWDDLFVLFGTPAEKEMIAVIKEQFDKDYAECSRR